MERRGGGGGGVGLSVHQLIYLITSHMTTDVLTDFV